MWSLRTIAASVAALYLSFLTPAPLRAAPSLALVRTGDRLYLRRGKERLLLSGTERRSVPRAGGWSLLLSPDGIHGDRHVEVRRHGKAVARLSLDDLRAEWLKNDSLWGPGKAGNHMRYIDQSAGGIRAFLYEAQATPTGWVGVLSWRMLGPSFEPIRVRHLVHLAANPRAKIEPVRLIEMRDQVFQPTRQLYRHAGKLLLHESDRLTELDGDGKTLRPFMRLSSPGEPFGLLQSRWLIRMTGSSWTAGGIGAVDLREKKSVAVLRRSTREEAREYLRIIDADDTTGCLLVERVTHGVCKELLQISIPSGRVRPIQAPWTERILHLWKGLFINLEGEAYCVYDAGTLRLVKKLRFQPDP